MYVIMCSVNVMLGLVSALSCRVGASNMSITITLNADCNSPSLRRLPSSSSCWAARLEGVASTWLAPIVWWCLTQTGTLPMTTRPWHGAGETGRKSSALSTGLSLSVLQSQSQGWPAFFYFIYSLIVVSVTVTGLTALFCFIYSLIAVSVTVTVTGLTTLFCFIYSLIAVSVTVRGLTTLFCFIYSLIAVSVTVTGLTTLFCFIYSLIAVSVTVTGLTTIFCFIYSLIAVSVTVTGLTALFCFIYSLIAVSVTVTGLTTLFCLCMHSDDDGARLRTVLITKDRKMSHLRPGV